LKKSNRIERLLPFVEEFGTIFENYGVPRMSGRILGWLLVSDPPHQSAGQLATVLQASKGAISSATQMLTRSGLVKRVKFPGDRKTYYVIPVGIWAELNNDRNRSTARYRKLAKQGLELIQDDPPEIQERLEEMHHIHAFFERERPKMMQKWLQEWEAYNREKDNV
jgi:DNA-binding transcriptional regulator GbsR (MarR family)